VSAAHLLRALMLAALTSATTAPSAQSTGDAMTQFARAHPQCQQWTDWRRLCSRTGPKGQTNCRRDSRVSVASSAPFCVAGAWQGIPWYAADTPAQHKSRLRFCAVTDTEEFRTQKLTICREYHERRPFNGAHLDAVYDDRCQVVRMISRNDDVCRSDGKSGAPSCKKSLGNFRATRPLYCAKWKLIESCEIPILSAPAPTVSNDIIVAPNLNLTGSSVWGPYCAISR
jgi:hypothetical protein